MRAVCDTSSLIRLGRGGALDCLGHLFDSVMIPEAVRAECKKPETLTFLDKTFIEVCRVEKYLALEGLGLGERAVISLAVECSVPIILLDDEKAAKRALEAGCQPIRTPQALLLAKFAGHLPSVRTALERMRDRGEGIEDEVFEATLASAGEL